MVDKALKYAEERLGVHDVYKSALSTQEAYTRTSTEIAGLKSRRLTVQDQIEDRKAEISIEERGKHPDMAVTRFEEHIKSHGRTDDKLAALRHDLREVSSAIASRELLQDGYRIKLKILTARMEELGGYLSYLAAIKNASVAIQPAEHQPEEPTSDRDGAGSRTSTA